MYRAAKYRAVDKYLDSFTFEDMGHFVMTFSLYIFSGDVLPSPLSTMWRDLRGVVKHYLYDVSAEGATADARAAAYRSLLSYAKGLERHDFPPNLFTFNLHQLVCR
jgi:hypothetical protein